MKKCSKCKEIKQLTEFYKHKSHPDGLTSECKICNKIYRDSNKLKIKERWSNYYNSNKTKVNLKNQLYRKNNKEKIKSMNKKWNEENKEYIKQQRKIYVYKNKEKLNAWHKLDRIINKDKYSEISRKPERRFKKSKKAAEKRKFDWNLTFEQWTELVINKVCHYCDGKLPEVGSALDRKDNNLDYIYENVIACCKTCNMIKGDSLTYNEMIAVSNLLKDIRKSYCSSSESSTDAGNLVGAEEFCKASRNC